MPSHSRPEFGKRLLIAGFGDLGRRLASRLSDQWQIHALRRSCPSDADSNSALTSVQADLTQPDSLAAIAGHWDAVVYTATPSQRTPEGYRAAYVQGLENLLQRIETERLIFVSSTAVYGQEQGEWVDEHSVTEPRRFNGRILLDAEQLAQRVNGIVVRFSGIYGPGRSRLIERVQSGPIRCRREPPIWTNRIHADDCAAALAHLLQLDSPHALYLASDHVPATRWEVYAWLARQLAAPGPLEVNDRESGQGKRVRNARLLSSGFTFQYPGFKDGYRQLIDAAKPELS